MGQNRSMTLRRKLSWVAVLYFAEGMPFGLVKEVLPVYFRVHDVDLTEIGLASLLGLPWTLKVLWSPLVDRVGRREDWIGACLLAMSVLTAAIPLFEPGAIALGLWVVLIALTCASSTQDIAVDAYTIGLADDGEEGDINGVRVSAYRVALIVAGGGLLLFRNWLGWHGIFWAVAAIFAALALATRAMPSRAVAAERGRGGSIDALRRWVERPGAWALFAFILIYKLGDAAMAPMVKPFWVDRGLAVEEIGLVSTSIGVAATIAGALVGGRLTDRWGIMRGLLILGAAQAVSNLGYAGVAWFDPPAPALRVSSLATAGAALVEPARISIYAASLIESFTAGLGTAAFLAFLMHVCEKKHAAVQYALLSAIFAFSRDIAGAASGWATTQLGYEAYFAMTFLFAFPGLAMLPLLRPWIRPPTQPGGGREA
jgi:PAT family beta-lactamase induction signal transducer AmpG